MTRGLLARLETTCHRAELKPPGKGRKKPTTKACGVNEAGERRWLDHKLALTSSPVLKLDGKEKTQRAISLLLGLWNHECK